MAAFEDMIVPRKRMATYGKAGRKRIPEHKLGSPSEVPLRRQSEPSRSRSPSIVPGDVKKLKSITRTPPSISPPSAPSVIANVFDVPSSDDEATPATSKPAPRASTKPTKNPARKAASSAGSSHTIAVDMERRKRIKLSPVRPLLQNSSSVKHPGKLPISEDKTYASKQLQKISATGVAKPKLAAIHPKADIPRTPRKLSPAPQMNMPSLSTPSPQLNAIEDPMDMNPSTKDISPRGLQMWKELLDSTEGGRGLDIVGSEGNARGGRRTAQLLSKTLYTPAGVTANPQRASKLLPRKRLIDSLVEQITHDDEMEDDEPDFEELNPELKPDSVLDVSDIQHRSRKPSPAPELAPPPTLLASQASQTAGPKYTYSRQRSMLAEEDLMQQLALDMPTQPVQPPIGRKPRRGSIPVLKPFQSFHEEAEAEDGTTTIRSVHELRQAGANNRFLDEIEDLLDRIGDPSSPPSSMRRSGLLDLASKIKDKNFVRQFRANGVEQRLFVHLGQETDTIAGFLMISILLAVLFEASMPHIVAQLRRQGITRLLIRLFESQSDIVSLSKDRKSNMSKVAQSLVLENQAFLLKISLWEDLLPQVISCRTVALKCLELMVRQAREAGNSSDIISKELTTKLFSILESASEESSWELPQGKQAIDFHLALSALESHSIVPRTIHDESIWISDYLPIIADALEVALKRPIDNFGPLQGLILRLTLNVTNNNPKASDVFAKGSLMAVMGRVIVTKFQEILRFLTEEAFSVAVDHLILALGVMINFAEWSELARESFQHLQGDDIDPLQSMVLLFMDNKMRTSEAESVEESQKNVAFGYLSVLLGYLSLLPAIATRIAAQQPRRTLRPLVESIEEFIGHHKAADILIEEAEDGYDAQTGLTERLERLVTNLRAIKVGEK